MFLKHGKALFTETSILDSLDAVLDHIKREERRRLTGLKTEKIEIEAIANAAVTWRA